MVYLEKKIISGNPYYYLTRAFRRNNKIKKLRKYLGKNPKFTIDFFEKTINEFVEEELNNIDFSYSKHLTLSDSAIQEIIKENLYISHLCEFDEDLKKNLGDFFPIVFIYNSNSIEGSTMPLEEVENYILKRKTSHQNRNEIKEVENSIECFKYLDNGFNFTMKAILKLHKILTDDLYYDLEKKQPYSQGFKKVEIVVGNMMGYSQTTEPALVRTELSELLKWYKAQKKMMNPLRLAFTFYAKFERIHPFEDGNGRIGRLIMNKILMDNNYLPFIIYTSNKRKHAKAFDKLMENKNIQFNDFLVKQYRKSLRLYYKLAVELQKQNKIYKSKYFKDE